LAEFYLFNQYTNDLSAHFGWIVKVDILRDKAAMNLSCGSRALRFGLQTRTSQRSPYLNPESRIQNLVP